MLIGALIQKYSNILLALLIHFPSTEKDKISVGAERQRRYRAMKRWRADPTEENFWGVVLTYAGVKFKTYSGLPASGKPAGSDLRALYREQPSREKHSCWESSKGQGKGTGRVAAWARWYG